MAYVGPTAANGSWNVTVVTGSSYAGLYAADGSFNVFKQTGTSAAVGMYHASGALNVAVAPASLVPYRAPDGSMYVMDSTSSGASGILLNRGQPVTVITGTLFGSLDAATTAWIAAVVANSGTVSAGRQTLVNNLIVGLKSDGVWAKLDRLWILAAENQPSALTDMVGDIFATAINSPTFTINRGFQGNGSTMDIDTLFTPSTAGGHYTQNSDHASFWNVTDSNPTNSGCYMGALSGSRMSSVPFTNPNAVFDNNSSSDFAHLSATTNAGYFINTRTSSTQVDAYRNGVSYATDPANTSVSNPTGDIFMFSLGGGSAFAIEQVAEASIGGGLTSTDATNFYNRLRTYMTAVGVP